MKIRVKYSLPVQNRLLNWYKYQQSANWTKLVQASLSLDLQEKRSSNYCNSV